MRYPLLDGFRGFFLLFMTVVHCNDILHTTIGKLNHHYFGWVEDAQGFVFISGFVVALVYGRALDRNGFSACAAATYGRLRTIYIYQALLIFTLLAVALLIPAAKESSPFGPYLREPVWFTAASLSLVGASLHMGILPMYIFFMAVLPFVLVSLSKGNWPAVLLGSVLVWLVGQTGLFPYAVNAIQRSLAADGIEMPLGLFFNLMSWQILFFTGAILGYQLNRKSLPLDLFKTEQFRRMAVISFFAIIVLGVFDRLVFWDILPADWIKMYLEANRRQHFGPLYVIAFAVALFFVSWVLIAGKTDENAFFRWVSGVTHAVVSHPFLIFLGQHSLQVFSFQILVVYALALAFPYGPPGELLGSVILLACVASLYIPAKLHELHQQRKKIAARA